MNNETFSTIVERRLQSLKDLLIKKGAEYASDKDRLHNFKKGSRMKAKHPLQVLDGMLLKHIISYDDMLEDIEAGKTIDYAYINEKLGDILAYFLLAEAVIIDTAVVTSLPGYIEDAQSKEYLNGKESE